MGPVLLLQVDDLDLAGIGPEFEKHPVFPAKINTEFVEVRQATFFLRKDINCSFAIVGYHQDHIAQHESFMTPAVDKFCMLCSTLLLMSYVSAS